MLISPGILMPCSSKAYAASHAITSEKANIPEKSKSFFYKLSLCKLILFALLLYNTYNNFSSTYNATNLYYLVIISILY